MSRGETTARIIRGACVGLIMAGVSLTHGWEWGFVVAVLWYVNLTIEQYDRKRAR